jgi:hypothetical protein
MTMKPEPIAEFAGQPQYAQATMSGPAGETLTIVSGRPPEIAGETERELEAGG